MNVMSLICPLVVLFAFILIPPGAHCHLRMGRLPELRYLSIRIIMCIPLYYLASGLSSLVAICPLCLNHRPLLLLWYYFVICATSKVCSLPLPLPSRLLFLSRPHPEDTQGFHRWNFYTRIRSVSPSHHQPRSPRFVFSPVSTRGASALFPQGIHTWEEGNMAYDFQLAF